ncbi:Transcriptional regulator of ribosomal biogenesis proteins [Toensbergia leucococca]|nr:Transcriptional regulator of ribosomal biogenesis proteins [Toensbergia leucococca]
MRLPTRSDEMEAEISIKLTLSKPPSSSTPPLTQYSTLPTAKLDSKETPPPLHYSPTTSDPERASTAESTPVGTPLGFGLQYPRKSEREKDLLFSWHRKQNEGYTGLSSAYVDSALLESDFDDSDFPLFGHSPPRNMSQTSPINIATMSRHSSPSPKHNPPSNLTSALQSTTGNGILRTSAMTINGGNDKDYGPAFGQRDSLNGGTFGMGPQYDTVAQPISMNNPNQGRPRQESLAGSMIGGMSWGGVSVGSWIRDDIIMQGTSPFPYQSPSFHSSSYLPKLEANFMRDFSCCGQVLPSLHELLQHYEEQHAQQMPPSSQKHQMTQINTQPDSKAAIAAGAFETVQQQARQAQQQTRPSAPDRTSLASGSNQVGAASGTQQRPQSSTIGFAPSQLQAGHDMDDVQDMEMDDDQTANVSQAQYSLPGPPRITQRSQFGQTASVQVTPLDINALNMGNSIQGHQGLRNSQPTTPVSAGRSGGFYQNNPTVSSVNTPTLTTHPLQQQQINTPDSSTPGTPGELESGFIGDVGNMSMNNQQFLPNQQHFGFDFGNGNDMLDLCIDEPAKRLFNPNGGFSQSTQYSPLKLDGGQYGENSELARTIREQQRMAGVPEPDGAIAKPFRCPVIGCEKAYKNQNGLKYHKSHGHNNQQLFSNPNGTYSILDPATSIPYPGTQGMEKEKPYRCEVCGKRYKNLNGLKYHKNHTPVCDTERREPDGMGGEFGGVGAEVNVAGGGMGG